MNGTRLLHLTPIADWEPHAARHDGDYRADSLDSEGFIHCSTVEQVLIPANERYRGRNDLVALVLDTDAIPSAVVFEDCYESGHAFPHVYGPIPVAAVIEVVPFPCEPDGSFQLPDTLR